MINLSNREQMAIIFALKKILDRKSLSKDRREALSSILMKMTVERHKVLEVKFADIK